MKLQELQLLPGLAGGVEPAEQALRMTRLLKAPEVSPKSLCRARQQTAWPTTVVTKDAQDALQPRHPMLRWRLAGVGLPDRGRVVYRRAV